MSALPFPAGREPAAATARTRLSQVAAVSRLELGRGLLSRRSMALYLLGAAPIALAALVAVAAFVEHESLTVTKAETVFASVYREFVLRWCVFFAVAFAFMNLFRGDVLDRSLHYFFLAPIRRELVVVGKYMAGLVSTSIVMGTATALTYMVFFASVPWAQAQPYWFGGAAIGHAVAYVGVTLLACAGYGALFLLIGLLFRNPIVPALAVLGWEYAHFLMPPTLKLFSVSFYLDSLLPVPVPDGLVAIVAEPVSPVVSVGGLLLFAGLVLVVAAARVRSMEIRYGSD